MRVQMSGGAMEILVNRIIELPQDPFRATSRDPHSGFIAYVPVGSVAKGEALVKTGGGGENNCFGGCDGRTLKSLAGGPPRAGLRPLYIVPQMCAFCGGGGEG